MNEKGAHEVKGLGILLIIFGAGMWVLPLLGLQLKFILFFTELLGAPAEALSIVLIIVGILLFYYGRKKAPTKAQAVMQAGSSQ